MLQRLYKGLGLQVNVLKWINSYHAGRLQFVVMDGNQSEGVAPVHGVPHGSILVSFHIGTYTTPVGDIVKTFGHHHHIYTDDKQLYIPSSADDDDETNSSINV